MDRSRRAHLEVGERARAYQDDGRSDKDWSESSRRAVEAARHDPLEAQEALVDAAAGGRYRARAGEHGLPACEEQATALSRESNQMPRIASGLHFQRENDVSRKNPLGVLSSANCFHVAAKVLTLRSRTAQSQTRMTKKKDDRTQV